MTRRFLLTSGTLAFLLLFSFIVFRTQIVDRVPAQQTERGASSATSQRPQPAPLSNAPTDQELGRRIEQVIASSDLSSARWGVFIMSARDGRILYARDAEHLFIPASNMKLYTTAVALDLLGADYRWRTSVYAAAAPQRDGTIDGDLVLYGRGAPDLLLNKSGAKTASSLAQLADELFKRGVRRVRGNVIGDESYFRGEPLGDGWLWNDVQWYFGAEVSALSIGGNEISLTVAPANKPGETATVELEPATDYVRLKNETMTVERGQPATIGINRGLSDNVVRVWGDFPSTGRGFNARLAVHKPALWAASIFREELRARGITVEGEAIIRDARSQPERDRFDPQRAVEIAYLTSKSLKEIARATNKESLNLEAELILRTLGKEKGAQAPDSDSRKMLTRGDDAAGLAVIRQWLERAAIPTRNLALHDGSGLSRLNLVTPEATARLLAVMSKSSSTNAFRDSLPIAGRDGTLGSRLRAASNRIFAKTGTLTYTNSLSGYALTEKDELLAFSIICNNETASASSTPVIDLIILALFSNKP